MLLKSFLSYDLWHTQGDLLFYDLTPFSFSDIHKTIRQMHEVLQLPLAFIEITANTQHF